MWANVQKTFVNCLVRTTAFADELPFTANPNDVEEHGRQIFHRCISGEFGEIGPYLELSSKSNDTLPVTEPTSVSVWQEVHEFLVEANAENSRGTSRGIGLVWGSMLEAMLIEVVQADLQRQSRGKNSLKCANGRKCGNNFNDWIEGAIHENMIDGTLGPHLHAIRRIRNACAHEWRLNFENPRVSGRKDDFDVLKLSYLPDFQLGDLASLMQMVFSSACCQIILKLSAQPFLESH